MQHRAEGRLKCRSSQDGDDHIYCERAEETCIAGDIACRYGHYKSLDMGSALGLLVLLGPAKGIAGNPDPYDTREQAH